MFVMVAVIVVMATRRDRLRIEPPLFFGRGVGVERPALTEQRGRLPGAAQVGHVLAQRLARKLCADKGMQIGLDGVQLLGGHGFVKEHPVERWYRDLRAIALMEGVVLV